MAKTQSKERGNDGGGGEQTEKALKRKVTICFNSDSRGLTIYRKQRIVVC